MKDKNKIVRTLDDLGLTISNIVHPISESLIDVNEEINIFEESLFSAFFDNRELFTNLDIDDVYKGFSNALEHLTLDVLKILSMSIEDNRYIIPFFYLEYGVYTKNKEIRKYLKECLKYHDIICNKDEDINDEFTPMYYFILYFNRHFNEIFDRKLKFQELDKVEFILMYINLPPQERGGTHFYFEDSDYYENIRQIREIEDDEKRK